MYRKRLSLSIFCGAVFLLAGMTRGEEILLKDGTKIVGKLVGVSGDSLEVQALYGKVKLPRASIVTISFPENQPPPPAQPKAGAKSQTVDEILDGTNYTNKTGHFRLTLPAGWKNNEEFRARFPGALAAFTPNDGKPFAVAVMQADFPPLSLQTTKAVLETMWGDMFKNYEKLSEADLPVDGRPGLRFIFRGTLKEIGDMHVKILIALVPREGRMTLIMGFAPEPLFAEAQTAFENIALSYRHIQD